MQTVVEKQKKHLIKRFHILLGQAGLGADAKRALLAGFGVNTSTDLGVHDLMDLCDALEKLMKPELISLDKWRKRVMAAIGGWLRVTGRESNAGVIKAIACRATGNDTFNDIPKERLINIYHAFVKKKKDFEAVGEIAREDYEILAYQN